MESEQMTKQATEQATEQVAEQTAVETPKKTRAPRRTPALVLGYWTTPAEFHTTATQPTGRAQREIESLRVWLRTSAAQDALMAEGVNHIDVVRKELVTADLCKVETVRAVVK